MQFRHTQLDNGLDVIAEVNPAAASTAVGFFVRTGSRDESDEVAGVSHFLEHMVFKGTGRRDAFEVNRAFDDLGAQYNAFTSEENTVFYGAVLPEHQSALLDLLGDVLRPALRQEDFDTEKDVIADEIARYQDVPSFRVYEKLMAAHFACHPLGRSILGTGESIRQMRREDMVAYFERRYSPGNVTLVGVGNLDFDALADEARAVCGSWPRAETPRDRPERTGAVGRSVVTDPGVTRQHVGFMSPAPSGQDESRYAAQLLATILGDVTGSRLFYALIEPALADEAHMSYDMMDHAGAFVTFVSTDPDQAPAVVDVVLDECRKFQADGAAEGELQAAKNKIASAATLKGEVPMGRLTAVGFDWVYRREYVPLAEQIEMMFAITGDQVLEVARTYDLTATTLLALGPREAL